MICYYVGMMNSEELAEVMDLLAELSVTDPRPDVEVIVDRIKCFIDDDEDHDLVVTYLEQRIKELNKELGAHYAEIDQYQAELERLKIEEIEQEEEDG